jgi:hypothetical protein
MAQDAKADLMAGPISVLLSAIAP